MLTFPLGTIRTSVQELLDIALAVGKDVWEARKIRPFLCMLDLMAIAEDILE